MVKSFQKKVWVSGILLCMFITAGFSRPAPFKQGAGPDVFLPIIFGPQPTPPPASIEILPNSTAFVDGNGFLHIAGEVNNPTADHLHFVQVSAGIFDTGDHLVGSGSTYTTLTTLPAHDKTCFEMIMEEPAGAAYYRMEELTYSTGGVPLPPMSVLNRQGTYDPDMSWYDVTGQVRNDSGRTVKNVSPVGTLYNAQGQVLGCDYSYVDGIHLAPSQTSAFTISFTQRDYAEVTNFRIQVEGDIQ